MYCNIMDCGCEDPPETDSGDGVKVHLTRNTYFEEEVRDLLYDTYGDSLPDEGGTFLDRIDICTDGVTITLSERP